MSLQTEFGMLFPPDPAPALPSTDERILVGTSGYSFRDWVGPFYPESMKPSRHLEFYTRQFAALELNVSHYRVPDAPMLARIARRTPPGFHFTVKLHKTMTHDRTLETIEPFRAALEPLRRAGKLDGLLAQFPYAFRRDAPAERHLETLRERFPEAPMFAEFRHDSWLKPDLADWLRERRIGYVIVDEPRLQHLLPPVSLLTGEDAYVRFHGRNQETWWNGGHRRYDYAYKEQELREWVSKIAELAQQARRTYLFFNNCHAGHAAHSAKLMQDLLRQQKLITS
jgi:uncharacterized protein YecE (DUF72 family)